ncbi:MAG: phosphatidate cytidylyltransferase [Acidaminococcaceae bacterium]|nr:phosphatidate cytidylyltransferase [Acidaminococcaceae bacterium]
MFKRILTGIIGIPVAVFLVTRGGLFFTVAVIILSLAAWREYARMADAKDVHTYKLTSFLPSMLLVAAAGAGKKEYFMPILTFAVLGILFEGLFRHCNCGEANWSLHVSNSLMALLYVGLLFAHIPLIREYSPECINYLGLHFSQGELALWMVLLGTWASDTFAYFFGIALGKHKFCFVSPKKSMEGAAAGFIFAFAVTGGIAYHGLHTGLIPALLLGLTVAFFAPVGDLIESILKRSFEIKDSGNFFPGHGGVLDRFDSLLFAVPAVYYVMKLLSV